MRHLHGRGHFLCSRSRRSPGVSIAAAAAALGCGRCLGDRGLVVAAVWGRRRLGRGGSGRTGLHGEVADRAPRGSPAGWARPRGRAGIGPDGIGPCLWEKTKQNLWFSSSGLPGLRSVVRPVGVLPPGACLPEHARRLQGFQLGPKRKVRKEGALARRLERGQGDGFV